MIEHEVIEAVFDLGGLLSGGSAVSLMFNHDFSKDLDFFFDSKKTADMVRRLYSEYKYLDICYYNNELPYSSFDLDISQVFIDKTGSFNKSDVCESAFCNKTVGIIKSNIISPKLSFIRLVKYANKFNLKTSADDFDFLKDLYDSR